MNSAHTTLKVASLLLLLALAVHCDRRRGGPGLEPAAKTDEPVTEMDSSAAPVVSDPVPTPVARTKPSPAPVVKKAPVRVSDYEARRRQLVERWEGTRTESKTVTDEQHGEAGTPASAPESTTLRPKATGSDTGR